jgi:hypothetical protein
VGSKTKKSTEVDFINKLSTVIAETYQIIGRVEWEYEKYKGDLIPCMDLLNAVLHEADVYFEDNAWDLHDGWVESQLKKYRKNHKRWLRRQELKLKKEKSNA